MRNEIEKFNRTVAVLVAAYLNNTLRHGECAACAVGNIIAAEIGAVPTDSGDEFLGWSWMRNQVEITVGWHHVFCTSEGSQKQSPLNYYGQIKRQIDASGYTWKELAKIEAAFESSMVGESEDDWMFNGLMDVVEVLSEIHGISIDQKEAAKLQFVKA